MMNIEEDTDSKSLLSKITLFEGVILQYSLYHRSSWTRKMALLVQVPTILAI